MPASVLRVLTCGSVDDGKSTLICRMLFECDGIQDDVLATLERDSRRFGTVENGVDYALLVDGLEAEREQGVTIDAAYRFFETDKYRFILADSPGHQQYTRNMATGASTADVAVLLIDARKGILPQTRRHAVIASLLGVKQVVLAINKTDLVGFAQSVFTQIDADFELLRPKFGFQSVTVIPIVARDGDNVTTASSRMPWYSGPCLLAALEAREPTTSPFAGSFRMPVQYVNRPDHTFRGYCGTVVSGSIRPGDLIRNTAARTEARVERIVTMDGD